MQDENISMPSRPTVDLRSPHVSNRPTLDLRPLPTKGLGIKALLAKASLLREQKLVELRNCTCCYPISPAHAIYCATVKLEDL